MSSLWHRSVDHGQICRTSNKTRKRLGQSGDATFPWLNLWNFAAQHRWHEHSETALVSLLHACAAPKTISLLNAVLSSLEDLEFIILRLQASIARYQLKHRRYFIIEYPQTSRIWYLKCMQQSFSDPSVTWGDFHFCAYGLKDPESGLRSLKPTSLMHCLPSEVMRPIFRRGNFFQLSQA